MVFRALLLSLLLFLSYSVFGKDQPRPIAVHGGTLKPHETLALNSAGLQDGCIYILSCKIKDLNNAKNHVHLRVFSWDYDQALTLNGKSVDNQFVLDQVDNNLLIGNFDNFSGITITNLDDNDSVELSCMAVPIYSWD